MLRTRGPRHRNGRSVCGNLDRTTPPIRPHEPTNDHRISRLLDVRWRAGSFGTGCLSDLRRRHANDLVAHMLTVHRVDHPAGRWTF
jgi:hypothetical protein